MRLRADEPPSEQGLHAGRPYWLWEPTTAPPWPAMVILHGAGSAKENHAGFGRACAGQGWLSVAYDQRGHGESTDLMGPEALGDVRAMAMMLAERSEVDPGRVCVRGSSMGGFLAIHAAAAFGVVAGAIAICPAWEDGLRRGLREGRFDMRVDGDALDAWLGEHDVREAVGRIAPKPLMLMHARGDEQVPVEQSEELHRLASEPNRLIVVPGGDHRSVQHDPELHAASLTWLSAILNQAGG